MSGEYFLERKIKRKENRRKEISVAKLKSQREFEPPSIQDEIRKKKEQRELVKL